MTATPSIDLSGWLTEQLDQASPDLLRQMITTFVTALMGAEADAICRAEYGVRSDERTNTRNGYRDRDWDTRVGTIDLTIPKLRSGSYFPDWIDRLSKSQVSQMSKALDEQVEAFCTRPLDAGPYTFLAADALVLKVREGGRTVNVHALLATAVNADGHRKIPGLHVTSSEDGAGWLAGVLPRPDRPRTDRRQAGHLRRAPWPGRGHRRDTALRCLATLQKPLRRESMTATPRSVGWVKAVFPDAQARAAGGAVAFDGRHFRCKRPVLRPRQPMCSGGVWSAVGAARSSLSTRMVDPAARLVMSSVRSRNRSSDSLSPRGRVAWRCALACTSGRSSTASTRSARVPGGRWPDRAFKDT